MSNIQIFALNCARNPVPDLDPPPKDFRSWQRSAVAPWTRPSHELVVGYGLFTAAEFALMARRHMLMHGTTPDQLATVAATIRNNGHVNPEAVYHGRGPFKPADILASRMVADPFHLLDCAMTSEGGCGLVLARADRATDVPHDPVYILGGNSDSYGPAYQIAPVWDMRGRSDVPAGYVGSTTPSRSRSSANSRPSASVVTARAARSWRTGTSPPTAACPSRPTAAP